METLNERLAKLLKENGLSYRKLAQAMSVSAGTINNWMHGQAISDAHLERLAALFGVDVAWLRYGRDIPVLDEELLQAILKSVEDQLQENDLTIPVDKKAAMVIKLYKSCIENGHFKDEMVKDEVLLAVA